MKKYVYLGKIVNTHGIKGEVRIQSNFDKKESVFVHGFSLYIGEDKLCEAISTYRVHKDYDMVTFKGITNINDVLKYKGLSVYVLRDSLKLQKEEYLLEDLLHMSVFYKNAFIGEVVDIGGTSLNILLKVQDKKSFYIPYHHEFIKKVELENNKIIVENIEGLMP